MTNGAVDVRLTADRIEELVGELGAGRDPLTRRRVEELARKLMELYGAALRRIRDLTLDNSDATGEQIWRLVADDPLVGSLLALHDLHPQSLESRVDRVLNRLAPVLAGRGIRIALAGIDEDALRLRVEAGAQAAVASARELIERAMSELVPDIDHIEFEGAAVTPPLLQIVGRDGQPLRARGDPRV